MTIGRRFRARHTPAFVTGRGRHLASGRRLLKLGSSAMILTPIAIALLLSPRGVLSRNGMTLPAMAGIAAEDLVGFPQDAIDSGLLPPVRMPRGPAPRTEGLIGASAWLVDGARVAAAPADYDECLQTADEVDLKGPKGVYEPNAVASMIKDLFTCMATVDGLDDLPPTSNSNWDGASHWGFQNLAEQVGAEAVVVAYCESIGFRKRALEGNNKWGYGGAFQMGAHEMRTFAKRGMSKFDTVDNTYAAARYFLYGYHRGASWGGWQPWAVVNTRYNDPINNQVKVPVLPRFASTDWRYLGRYGAELPDWAVFPETFKVPRSEGCPFNGRDWKPAQLLD